MSKEDIINYVMTTPGNPNRAVLTGMLDGVDATADWNEHNPEAKGYIANRPIYKDIDTVTTELFSREVELTQQSYPGFYYLYLSTPDTTAVCSIAKGDILNVNVDGINHLLEVKEDPDSSNALYVGAYNPGDNTGIQESLVGIAFVSYKGPNGLSGYIPNAYMMYLPDASGGGTHTFTVSLKQTVVVGIKKLDSELLPDRIPINNLPIDEIKDEVMPYITYSEANDVLEVTKPLRLTSNRISILKANLNVARNGLARFNAGAVIANCIMAGENISSSLQGSACLIFGYRPASVSGRDEVLEIAGNGMTFPHNARILDMDGNEKLAGTLTLGYDTADEVTVTAAQLKALLALLNA